MILWSVVDSQSASTEPFRNPPGAAAGPGGACRSNVVTRYPPRSEPRVARAVPPRALPDSCPALVHGQPGPAFRSSSEGQEFEVTDAELGPPRQLAAPPR